MSKSPPAVITDTLLYHYPSNQVFRAAVQAVRSLSKFRVDIIDERQRYIKVTTKAKTKIFSAAYSLKMNGIAPDKTNLFFTYSEELHNSTASTKAVNIKMIINTISKILD